MSDRRPWEDWPAETWLAYRNQIAAWLDAHPERPETVTRRCLAMADRHLARLKETA